jgi:hypothetical protein
MRFAFQQFHLPAQNTDSKCNKFVIWFADESGEKNLLSGFVCDKHKVSKRVKKLAQPNDKKKKCLLSSKLSNRRIFYKYLISSVDHTTGIFIAFWSYGNKFFIKGGFLTDKISMNEYNRVS